MRNVRAWGNLVCFFDLVRPKKLLHAVADETYRQGMHELHDTQKLADEVCRYDLDELDVTWLSNYNCLRLQQGKQAVICCFRYNFCQCIVYKEQCWSTGGNVLFYYEPMVSKCLWQLFYFLQLYQLLLEVRHSKKLSFFVELNLWRFWLPWCVILRWYRAVRVRNGACDGSARDALLWRHAGGHEERRTRWNWVWRERCLWHLQIG